jgi:hypothetical protein
MESPVVRDPSHLAAGTISYLKAPKSPAAGDPLPEHVGSSGCRAQIERLAQALAEQRQQVAALRTLLYRRDEELREARTTLALIASSRVYHLMRALGRWGWLEHRIRRVLR